MKVTAVHVIENYLSFVIRFSVYKSSPLDLPCASSVPIYIFITFIFDVINFNITVSSMLYVSDKILYIFLIFPYVLHISPKNNPYLKNSKSQVAYIQC